MRPEDTQRCVPDPDWETPEQQFDIALAKKQAEIDEAVWLLNPNGTNDLGALREWKKRYDAFMVRHKGE